MKNDTSFFQKFGGLAKPFLLCGQVNIYMDKNL
jgi:hypothetical protein